MILAVALLIFGPQRLPELASGLGKAIRQFRRATRDLQSQIEVDETVRRPIHELRAALRDEPPPIVPAAGTAPTSVTPSVAAVPHPAEGAPPASGLSSTSTPAEKTT